MKQHLMLDFETLGTKPNTAVLSLGAVLFDEKSILDKRYWIFNVADQLKTGRTVDFSTLSWWMRQSEESRTVFKEAETNGIRLSAFVEEMRQWLKGREVLVWGNGATFDVSIIENIFSQASIKTPWNYTDARCYRTLKQSCGFKFESDFKGTKHNALDDALFQAESVQTYSRIFAARSAKLQALMSGQ